MVPPNGVCFARSTSRWIQLSSPVTFANSSISSCVTRCQSDTASWPTAALSSSIPFTVIMAAAYPAQFVPGPLLAVDAPSLLFRGFYALPDKITDDRKRPVNAILGATNLVLFEVERYRPRAVVMCFGPDAAPYRTELYSGYHADRAAAVPDGIVWQFEEAPGFYEKFGCGGGGAGGPGAGGTRPPRRRPAA